MVIFYQSMDCDYCNILTLYRFGFGVARCGLFSLFAFWHLADKPCKHVVTVWHWHWNRKWNQHHSQCSILRRVFQHQDFRDSVVPARYVAAQAYATCTRPHQSNCSEINLFYTGTVSYFAAVGCQTSSIFESAYVFFCLCLLSFPSTLIVYP